MSNNCVNLFKFSFVLRKRCLVLFNCPVSFLLYFFTLRAGSCHVILNFANIASRHDNTIIWHNETVFRHVNVINWQVGASVAEWLRSLTWNHRSLTTVQARRHDFVIGAANLVGLSQNLGGYGGMLPRKNVYSRMLSGAFSRIFGIVYSLPLVHVIVIYVNDFLHF
jgi:hypothetical protein